MVRIREVMSDDLPTLGRLFDEYRQFYKLPTDVDKATGYLEARLAAGDSVVLVAADESGQLIGFTQLYPTWCSQVPCTCCMTSTSRRGPAAAASRARCSRRARSARGAMASCG